MSITIVGNLGGDVDFKTFESGTSVAKFSVADRMVYTKPDAPTEWRNVEIWGRMAETANNYLKKGSLVAIVGELHTETYENKEGVTIRKPVIKGNRLVLLDKKTVDPDADGAVETPPTRQTTTKSSAPAASSFDDSDIPF